MIVATSDQDAADAIETVPGAFGGTTLAIVLSERRGIRVLSLNGIEPSARALKEGTYRYSKTFRMVTKRNPPAPVRRFIDFVFSPAGSAILEKNGQEPYRREGVRP
jgi:phosphate transport system substrate-binding protein